MLFLFAKIVVIKQSLPSTMFFYVQARGALLLTTAIEVASDSRGDNSKLVGPQGFPLNPKGNIMRGLHWTCQTAYPLGAKIFSSSSHSIRNFELPHCQLFCDSTRPTDMHIPPFMYWKWFHSSYFEIHPETCSMMWQCI